MITNEPDPLEPKPLDGGFGHNEHLQRAAQAAKALKPVEMVEALHASFLLDGLVRRIKSNWSSFSFQDAEDIVSESVDVLYQTVLNGKPVGGITSFLNKVSFRKACDLRAKRRHLTNFAPGSSELETPSHDSAAGDEEDAPRIEDEMPEWEEAMKQSIATARRLLPRLGQENIRLVMSMIFDALEAGNQDITNQEIGESLGLSSDTVRQAKSRGFSRLQRIAQEEGILAKNFDLKTIGKETETESEEPNEN